MTTTEQYLQYLAERARALKKESRFWSYAAWRYTRGYDRSYDAWISARSQYK